MTSAALVLGVGNLMRGDDGVGIAVARRLRARGLPGVHVMESDGDVGELVQALAEKTRVIAVDASHGGPRPGTIRRVDAGVASPVALLGGRSTHGLGLADAVELARRLGRLPPAVIVYAVEGRSFELGDGLSAEVAAAAADVEERIASELGAGNGTPAAVPHASHRRRS